MPVRLPHLPADPSRAQPYFGLGVNSAFEDVAVLGEELDAQSDLGTALSRYSTRRAAEARVLVQMSRSFDLGGIRSFVSFIGPIIMDGIFGSLPLIGRAFAPNTLAMLQKPTISFVAIRWRKRVDRAVQLALLTAMGSLAAKLAVTAATAAARVVAGFVLPLAVARPRLLALPALTLAAAAVAAGRQLLGRRMAADGASGAQLLRGGDVADVLASQTNAATPAEGDAELEQQPAVGGTRRGY